MYTKNLTLLFTLIISILLSPTGAHAQDYTHAPALTQIVDASDCDTVRLGHTAPRRLPHVYVPTLRNGERNAVKCPPDIYANAIAIDGAQYTITPVTRSGMVGFDGTSTFDLPVSYDLDQTLTFTESQELFSGEPPADGIYRELRYAFAVQDAGDVVFASQIDPNPDGPATLRDVHNANKAHVLDDWIKSGKMSFIQLPGATPLRIAPTTVSDASSLHTLCPHMTHLPTYTVNLVKTHLVPDFQMGGTVIRIWVQIRHTQEIRLACPAISLYTMVEGPTFFNAMDPALETQLEGQTALGEIEWRQKIILQPLEAGQQAIEATAAFIATPAGQALVIYVVVLTAAAVFIGPQVYVLILV